MIVVSDTTPINYLVIIGWVDVLPRLFECVLVPTTVIRELHDRKSPQVVRDWLRSPPNWLTIAEPIHRLTPTRKLDPGESDAIALAKERGIHELLMDDYHGRRVAESQGLVTLTTVTILERAAEAGFLDLESALNALRRTSYRAQPAVFEDALENYRQRHRHDDASSD